ncbi:unnamed protein product [Acanthosepion pharaonis]|uniref:Uncharacterized protein n=1 Tax=Acanthosepion pharaonis TaxID=158019 RepID=A0A812D124_ACAPH|nr:unnamed protein product [Sepia pharaonis]
MRFVALYRSTTCRRGKFLLPPHTVTTIKLPPEPPTSNHLYFHVYLLFNNGLFLLHILSLSLCLSLFPLFFFYTHTHTLSLSLSLSYPSSYSSSTLTILAFNQSKHASQSILYLYRLHSPSASVLFSSTITTVTRLPTFFTCTYTSFYNDSSLLSIAPTTTSLHKDH